ncbi:hypothetical protein D3C81_1372340 [compost metagenome]
MIADIHVEAEAGTFGDGQANCAQAEDAEALATYRGADDPVPLAAADTGIGAGNVAQQRQQHRQGMVGHGGGIGTRAIGDGNATGSSGGQVDVFVTGADHADDLQVGQRLDFRSGKAQRAAGKHRIDFSAMALDGIGTQWRGRCADQPVAGLFEQVQVIIDGFHQHQDCLAHAPLRLKFEGALCGVGGRYSQSVNRGSTVLYRLAQPALLPACRRQGQKRQNNY